MKVDQFLSNYKENLILILLGIFYVFYAGFNFLSVTFNSLYFDNAIPGGGTNDIFETIKKSTADTVYNNMPYLLAIGVALMLFGLIYKKVKTIALPIFLIFLGIIVFWTIAYHNDLKKMMDTLNALYTDMGLYSNTPNWFSKLFKASQTTGYIRNASMFLFPFLLAGFLIFRPKKNKVPPQLPQ